MNLQQKHAGIILAAGASARMGMPKALLEVAPGQPLALAQANLLMGAPCETVIVVVGSQMEDLASRLAAPGVTVACNHQWERGRLSSLQVGLRAAGAVHGAIILPVDTVGVSLQTLAEIRRAAETTDAMALRPVYRGRPGKLAWISRLLFGDLLALPAHPEFKLHDWLKDREVRMEVEDPNILNNINTPAEWRTWQSGYSRCHSSPA